MRNFKSLFSGLRDQLYIDKEDTKKDSRGKLKKKFDEKITSNKDSTNSNQPGVSPDQKQDVNIATKRRRRIIFWVILIVLLIILLIFLFSGNNASLITSDALRKILVGESDNINWSSTSAVGYYYGNYSSLQISIVMNAGETRNYVTYFATNTDLDKFVGPIKDGVGTNLQELLGSRLAIGPPPQPSILLTILITWGPWLVFLIIAIVISQRLIRRQAGQFNFSSKKLEMVKTAVRFDDVAGYPEIKAELKELVDYLKDPKKFNDAGARIPRGVLVTGPPGTGKTLIARAVAGESSTPFFQVSGSDFIEMFAGVGATRVRSLFKKAKENAPCVIFIDELDAIGKRRETSFTGGSVAEDREQTLNQLLVELDGFNTREGILVMGATNRPETIDPALVRPGRIDRVLQMRLPNLNERERILELHSKGKKISSTVDFGKIAKRTAGFSGAQLENVLNEAIILAIRENKDEINTKIIDEAIDRVILGPSKENLIISQEEKELIAYHESGHAVLGLVVPHSDKVNKITIIPRGDAGGYVLMSPNREKIIQTKGELEAKLITLFGGRAAEEILYGNSGITSGARADIDRATVIAKTMVLELGMGDSTPLQRISGPDSSRFLGSEISTNYRHSDKMLQKIDDDIANLLKRSFDTATKLLKKHHALLKEIAVKLIEQEVINEEEIDVIYSNYTKKINDKKMQEAAKKDLDE